jgi:mono/diheme cytochrome c family protein
MPTLRARCLAVIGSVALLTLALLPVGFGAEEGKAPTENKFSAEDIAFFEKEVLPILKANCYKCHGEGRPRGGLRLNSRENLLQGGDTGPAISLEKPEESLLLKAVRYEDGLEMPPKNRLTAPQVATLAQWVKKGAPWSKTAAEGPTKETPHAPKHSGGVVTAEAKKYWAYQPVQRPAVPEVKNKSWVQNSVDAFVLAKLEAKGLSPAPTADKVALLRRATYDLTGLPPTPEEVDAFVKDTAPDAYEKLIDKLLASPHYGEKWGRHWLDLVRYAETNGYERDGPKPFAWRYRDYVIRSFNADKPYDRFLLEQLAGDEIDRDNPEAIIATGYYRLGLWDDEPADPKQARFDEFDDLVATTSQVCLAMTMNCARCHDHKIDPIPQKDYYRLLAFFRDIPPFSDSRNTESRNNLTDISPPDERKENEAKQRQREDLMQELRAKLTALEEEAIKKMPAADQRASEGRERPKVVAKVKEFMTKDQAAAYEKAKLHLDLLRRERPKSRIMALSVNRCLVKPPPTHVMIRGNPNSPGALVEPGFPAVLGTADPVIPPPDPEARTSGRRQVFARWIASPTNPLTARVMANRLWQHHFGRGIVASTNDFGKFGTPPTHPELLDWLASEFVAGGWHMKRMHRLLMLSNTYRMSSQGNPTALWLDPANNLFWRFNMRRLNAEEVRDSVLAVSGRLNRKMYGPSVFPPIPKEVLAGQSIPGQGWGHSPPEEAARRSIYVHVKRSLLVPVLAIHDQADTDTSCPVRYTTTVPTQALGMLNGQFMHEQATALAERLQHEAPNDRTAQVRRAIRLTTGRQPQTAEVQKDLAFLTEMETQQKLAPSAAMKLYCLMILNTNEFVYLD